MQLSDAITRARSERPNRRRLIIEANEVLALYFGGYEEMRPLIDIWGPQEDPANYAARLKVTVENYRNFPKQIVAKYLEAIKRAGGITRTTSDKDAQEYLDKKYAQWFWNEVAPYLLTLPEFWTQAAYPLTDGEYQTEQQQLDMQGNPYVIVHYPQFIRNFEMDRDGSLLWVTLERPSAKLLANGSVMPIVYVDYYDAKEYVTYSRKEGNKTLSRVTEPMDHGFDGVPFRRFAFQENNALAGSPKIGHARMSDITRRSKGLLHWIAMQVEAGHIHLRLQLVGPKKTIDAIKEEGMGNSSMIPEDASGLPVNSHPLRYLEKPVTELNQLNQIYTQLVQEIFEDARLRDPSVKTVQSGVAKLLDMVPDLGVNNENRDYLQSCDEEILGLVQTGRATKPPVVECKYPQTFDVKSINEKTKEIADAVIAMRDGGLPRSTTADIHLALQIYHDLWQDATDQELTAIATDLVADAAAKIALRNQQDLQTAPAFSRPSGDTGEAI